MRHTILILSLLVPGLAFAQDAPPPAAIEASEAPEAPEAPEASEAPETELGSDDSVTRKRLALTPEIVAKLDGEQLQAVLKEKELTKRQHAGAVGPDIVAPLGFFFSMMVIVFLPLFFRWRQQMLLHETLRAMVEKGAEIPVELITPQKRKPNDLRRGVILLAMGVGLSIFLALIPDVHTGVWACGLIPALMGAGYLAVWRLQQKEERANSQSRE